MSKRKNKTGMEKLVTRYRSRRDTLTRKICVLDETHTLEREALQDELTDVNEVLGKLA